MTTTAEWFGHLYPDADGWVSIFAVHRASGTNVVRWAAADDHQALADHCAKLEPEHCVWAGVATRATNLGRQRGGRADCIDVPALWLDVDVAGPGHADHPLALPPTKDDARALIDAFAVPPTVIVDTGGGLQPWWLLDEPAAAAEAEHVLTRWGHTWRTLAEERFGWWLDPVWNVDRVLRVPGTTNRKVADDPRPVEIVAADWNRRYGLRDLDDLLTDPPPPPAPKVTAAPYEGPDRPGDTFNAHHSTAEVLERLGFHSPNRKRNGDTDYVRPGKDRRQGYSATVYASDGHATIWSSTCRATWPDIETERPYDAFGLVVATSYDGDFAEAGRDLRAQGYGEDRDVDLSWIPDAPVIVERQAVEGVALPVEMPPVRPLPGIEGSTPSFPIEELPEWIAEPCRQVADGLQVPVDLPVHIALGCLSTVTQGKVRVSHGPWREWTNLYLAVAVPSGTGKSPAFARLTSPIYSLEAERRSQALKAQTEAETKRNMKESAKKKAEAAGDETLALKLAVELAEMEAPPSGPALADDATPEALAQMMADTGGTLAILSSEGQVFDQMCGQYVDRGAKANIDIYKKGHSGDRLQQARVKRGLVDIERALLTIAVATQPSVIDQLKAAPELASQGVTARFLYAVPVPNIGWRDRSKNDAPIDVSAWVDEVTDLGRRLARYQRPLDISFSPEAASAFDGWDQALEVKFRPGGELALMVEWCTKLRSSVIRLCGITAACDGEDEVSVATLARVLRIADYWIAHAKTVHSMWGVGGPDDVWARRIARWLVGQVEDRGRERVTFNELVRAFHRQIQAEAPRHRGGEGAGWSVLPEPLSILIEAGWLVPEVEGWERQKGSGKASPVFLIGDVGPDDLVSRPATTEVIDGPVLSNVTESGDVRNKSVHSVASVAKGGSRDPHINCGLLLPTDPATHATHATHATQTPGQSEVSRSKPAVSDGAGLFGGPWDDDLEAETATDGGDRQ